MSTVKIPAWIRKALGPQQVGGRYHNYYWDQEYEVLEILLAANEHAPHPWCIRVRWADGRESEHWTAWDRRDTVIADPPAALPEQAS